MSTKGGKRRKLKKLLKELELLKETKPQREDNSDEVKTISQNLIPQNFSCSPISHSRHFLPKLDHLHFKIETLVELPMDIFELARNYHLTQKEIDQIVKIRDKKRKEVYQEMLKKIINKIPLD